MGRPTLLPFQATLCVAKCPSRHGVAAEISMATGTHAFRLRTNAGDTISKAARHVSTLAASGATFWHDGTAGSFRVSRFCASAPRSSPPPPGQDNVLCGPRPTHSQCPVQKPAIRGEPWAGH